MSKRTKRNIIRLAIWIVMPLVGISIFSSCGHKRKQEPAKLFKPVTVVKSEPGQPAISSENISLFDFSEFTYKGEDILFASVSEADTLSHKVDSLVIPDIKDKKPEETTYIKLKSRYRKRLLKNTGISETDTLFIYDYAHDGLLKLPVSSVSTIASLSFYVDVADTPHTVADYMLGFEIKAASLDAKSNDYLSNGLIYIGKINPFTKGQMHPILWERIDPKKIPSVPLKSEDAKWLKGFNLSSTYTFQSDGFHYYLQQFTKGDVTPSNRVLVTNSKNEVVYSELYYEMESVTPTPLSFVNGKNHELSQWTGRLFKNKPPVLFGFDSPEFGCPWLRFLDKSGGGVNINCDNRH